MRHARTAAFVCAAFALTACAGEKVWMRSGSSSLDADNDEMNCAVQAESSGSTVTFGDAPPPHDRFSQRYACLRSQGYKLKSLTSEEAARLKSLGGADREEYWTQILAKNGFAAPKPERAPPPLVPADTASNPSRSADAGKL